MRVLFPYVSPLGVNADWGVLGTVLFWMQCPLYAVSIATPTSGQWRWGVQLVLVAVHGCAIALAFHASG